LGKIPSKTNFGEIFDEKKVDEIIKIVDRLDEDEEVLMVVRQTKNLLKPGSSLITPDIIFATTKKIIIRIPSALGLRQNIEIYPYEKIVDIKLQKGIFSSSIDINVPGSIYDGYIDAIPKDEAEKLLKIIYKRMLDAEEKGNKPAPSDDDSLSILKKRYAKGEISKEEFQQIKQDLENSSQIIPEETQFWVCPHCGGDTQTKNEKQFCSKCNVYL